MTFYVVRRKTMEFAPNPVIPSPSGGNNLYLKTKNPKGVDAVEVVVVDGYIEVSIADKEEDVYASGTNGQGPFNWTEYKQILGKLVLATEYTGVADTYGSGSTTYPVGGKTEHLSAPGRPPAPWHPVTNPNPQPGPPIELEYKRVIPVSHGKFRWYLYLTEYDFPIDYDAIENP